MLPAMASKDERPLDGQVALITGANTGIGRVTARELARRGAQVFIACRSAERARPVLDELRAQTNGGQVELVSLDLADFASVRECAQGFLARGMPLHLLINNAGVAGARGMTASGFEQAFGVNHMGHFLLTRLLQERIVQSAPARVVTVASKAHFRAPGIDWDAVRRPSATRSGVPEYSVSKLANVLFSAELGRRLAGSGVTACSLHPGVVASDVWRAVPWPLRGLLKIAMMSTEDGAATSLYCATSPVLAGESGLYYDKSARKPASEVARDPALAAELWKRSEDWVTQ
jgi:retinol dehydrogenase 12